MAGTRGLILLRGVRGKTLPAPHKLKMLRRERSLSIIVIQPHIASLFGTAVINDSLMYSFRFGIQARLMVAEDYLRTAEQFCNSSFAAFGLYLDFFQVIKGVIYVFKNNFTIYSQENI